MQFLLFVLAAALVAGSDAARTKVGLFDKLESKFGSMGNVQTPRDRALRMKMKSNGNGKSGKSGKGSKSAAANSHATCTGSGPLEIESVSDDDVVDIENLSSTVSFGMVTVGETGEDVIIDFCGTVGAVYTMSIEHYDDAYINWELAVGATVAVQASLVPVGGGAALLTLPNAPLELRTFERQNAFLMDDTLYADDFLMVDAGTDVVNTCAKWIAANVPAGGYNVGFDVMIDTRAIGGDGFDGADSLAQIRAYLGDVSCPLVPFIFVFLFPNLTKTRIFSRAAYRHGVGRAEHLLGLHGCVRQLRPQHCLVFLCL